jgi:ribonuclease BN (tRNA processing enzyme)
MRLMLLGTRGWIPGAGRETTCVTVDHDGELLIFDAGTGLSRLLQAPGSSMLESARHVRLFLTHFHLDHVCGLAYVPGIFAGRSLTVHAPAQELTGVDPERAIAELIRAPYNPRPWAEIDAVRLTVAPLAAGDNHVGGHVVRVRVQQHTPPSVAYRLDDSVVLATDTTHDLATAEFARGVEVLLHEAWIDGVEEGDPAKADLVRNAYAGHTSARRAADLAAKAQVGELILMHLNPFYDEGYYRQMEMSARDIFAPTSIYPDLYQRELMG